MQNNQFDIAVSGDYVRTMKHNNGTNLFRIAGPGSLQGGNAADALISAFTNAEAYDDTYTILPFQVTDTRGQSQQFPLLFIPVGSLVFVLGIVLWKRN